MYLIFFFFLGAFQLLVAQINSAPTDTPVLRLDLDHAQTPVSPTLYGLMTEEINYSYDGGLYAELIRNRTFKDDPKLPVHWSLVQGQGGGASMTLDEDHGPNEALNSSLRLQIAESGARTGIANDGFWGIPLQPMTTYEASFFARPSADFSGPLTVSLESEDGATTYAQSEVPRLHSGWNSYTVSLKTEQLTPGSKNRFVISAHAKGTIWFTLVSLFPPTYKDRPNGDRIDLMEKLAAMQPAFLRFPGGNYLQGQDLLNYFNWKKTIHSLVERPGHFSPWKYHSSDGLGLLEFLEWCEDLHMQPVLAVFAGYTLNHTFVKPGEALQPYVQDALDEIEYVTGDAATTKWGAVRARDGHPAPFALTYLEVGNEDKYDRSKSYEDRFSQFYHALKEKYPRLQIIATTPVKKVTPDLVDDHFYRSPEGFFKDVHHYDKASRTGPKIFVGEWATREGEPTPNFHAALGDAAWMTGLERNSDLVAMSCYAPLFVNVNPGGIQWKTNLIGYNAMTSYGSPSYYAQVLFRQHLGNTIVPVTSTPDLPLMFYSATRTGSTLDLKVVNAGPTAQTVRIELAGAVQVKAEGSLYSLSAAQLTDTNSITEPTKIVPVTQALTQLGNSFSQTFPPYSIQVLELTLP